MTIPEGATHVSSANNYYKKNESGDWFCYSPKDKWFESCMNSDWYDKNLKALPTHEPDIPEGATHVRDTGIYYKIEGGEWFHHCAGEWWSSSQGFEWCRDNLKELPTPTAWEYVEFDASKPTFTVDTHDPVHKPKHYQLIDGVESIQVIACSLTRDEWRGFCLGNEMKYRLRAGKKDNLQQEIDKANEYNSLFEKYKELNRDER